MEKFESQTEFKGAEHPKLPTGEFEDCRFLNGNWSSSNFQKSRFTDCTFTDCDLSGSRLDLTTFSNCKFVRCKLLGLRFDLTDKHLFSVAFDECRLDMSSFYGRKMKNTDFINCSLKEVDFTQTDLAGSRFENCNLGNAVFEESNLEQCDFRTADDFSIDPEKNHLTRARFLQNNLSGLLHRYRLRIE